MRASTMLRPSWSSTAVVRAKPWRRVRRVDQHRGGAAHAARLERHQRLVRGGVALGEQPRVPGDLLGGVLQEIAGREARPDGGDAPLRRRRARAARRRAASCVSRTRSSWSIGRLEPAAQRTLDALVELVEQRGLPGIPQLRVGAAHVRAGEHVQVVEVRLVADLAREGVDDLRVADVLLLRGDRQHQVIAYQPGDQARVVAPTAPARGRTPRHPPRRARSDRRRGPWRCRGTAPPRYATSGLRQLLHDRARPRAARGRNAAWRSAAGCSPRTACARPPCRHGTGRTACVRRRGRRRECSGRARRRCSCAAARA